MTALRLAVEHLTASYNGAVALRDVSLEVRAEEAVVLLGPNGAGKTTLLKSVSGIKRPDRGRVIVDGEDMSRTSAYRRARGGVSLVPEGRHVFPRMTVLENIVLGAWPRRPSRVDLDEVFAQFPVLYDRRAEAAGALSGGEQQMLAIARALIRRPRLLLLDEPSMGLAPIMADRVFALIEQVRDNGVAVLVVEQSTAHSLQVASRAYILQQGNVVFEGEAHELTNSDSVLAAYFGRSEPDL